MIRLDGYFYDFDFEGRSEIKGFFRGIFKDFRKYFEILSKVSF
jgi:hypothetical protein